MPQNNVNVFDQLLFWKQCKRYGLRAWECPSVLFVVMGFLTIFSIIATYAVANTYASPDIVIIMAAVVTVVVFTIGSIIVQSFERVARANIMKTEFVSIASHQLRTPLSSIKWSLDLFLNNRLGDLPPKQGEYLRSIHESNERMIRLVNDLLNVSRIEGGGISIKQEPVVLNEVIVEIAREMRSFAEASNKKIIVDIPASTIQVLGDRQYIRMSVENLLDNAVRYSGDNVEIRLMCLVNKHSARIEVRDGGIGIPLAEQKHVFNKFFRSQNVVHQQIHGTGLGLFIARSVMNAMGGKMGFSSEEGRGSTFWFELPLILEK